MIPPDIAVFLPLAVQKADRFDAGFEVVKNFRKNQFDDFPLAALQIDGTLHPKLFLVVQPETPFLGIVQDQLWVAGQNQHIPIVHLIKSVVSVWHRYRRQSARLGNQAATR